MRGYVRMGGTELVNDALTRSLIAECPEGCHFNLFGGDCDCEVLDELVGEPPWLSPDPRSGEFLGVMAGPIEIQTPITPRRVAPRGVGVGSSIGPLRLRHRTVGIEGLMVAYSERGLEYGERWISEVLTGSMCEELVDLCLLMSCDADGIRMMRDVGVIDGPVFGGITSDGGCWMRSVAFQVASEVPYLFAEPDVVGDGELVATSQQSFKVSTDEWVADAALVVSFTAGDTAATDLSVRTRVLLDGDCPEDRTPVCLRLDIPELPANSTLTVDATRRAIFWDDPLTLRRRTGNHLVQFVGQIPWPIVPPCTDWCVALDNSGPQDVTFELMSYPREL